MDINNDNKKIKDNKINIELTDEMAEGIYSNLAVITHSNAEFIIDFIKILPGMPKAKVKSRIVLTPQHAKRLMNALNDNLKKYESVYGKVEEKDSKQTFSIPFSGPAGQA